MAPCTVVHRLLHRGPWPPASWSIAPCIVVHRPLHPAVGAARARGREWMDKQEADEAMRLPYALEGA
ncbi:MAG: hypothetical protein J6I36_06415 [Bacteroidaceae bacterium]|nr:hypothetical protein [Bacteroidaceae bacterium]